LRMIFDTISFFKNKIKKWFLMLSISLTDTRQPGLCNENPQNCCEAGADCICLCDTNGGTFPNEIKDITARVVSEFNVNVGIHCHNDTGMAVANSIMAVLAGAVQVQGTMTGLEREAVMPISAQ